MMQEATLINAATLTLLGMGTVLLFLIVLIFAISLMEPAVRFIGKFLPEEQAQTQAPQKQDLTLLAVAIAAAKRK
ncbi:sodium pump decarboxylase [Parelusimicrobium proximum]|uniref:OadG family protein n=1 Tax=Parelusimicrobium proximum TaxID=3228953 RepID=UPI003D1784DF